MDHSSTFRPSQSSGRSLYVHVPFCRHRCGYCNFTLIAGRDDLIDRFLRAIQTEIGWLSGRQCAKTLFLGGGTPSHLAAEQFQRLFDIITTRFDFAADTEFTIECNPNDLTPELANAYKNCGVNRISFGVQSFDKDKLKTLERDHTPADIRAAVDIARTVTDNVSFDLIFASPAETVRDWTCDLQSAMSLSPSHLSTYELTIEKGTQFWSRFNRGQLVVPGEDMRAAMYETTIEIVDSNGFGHYEISSFAQPGKQCRHNQSYWNGSDYFGFGPGASRFIDGVRESNHRSTTAYLKILESGDSPVTDRKILDRRSSAIDRIVFGLRQIAGFSLSEFRNRTNLDAIELMAGAAELLIENSLIHIDSDTCRLTDRGIMLYDGVASEILAAAQA